VPIGDGAVAVTQGTVRRAGGWGSRCDRGHFLLAAQPLCVKGWTGHLNPSDRTEALSVLVAAVGLR
jgi:hypothetical protein